MSFDNGGVSFGAGLWTTEAVGQKRDEEERVPFLRVMKFSAAPLSGMDLADYLGATPGGA